MHESPFGRGAMGRVSSYGMGKLESLELPDAAAAVAMLHDMSPEVRTSAQLWASTAMHGCMYDYAPSYSGHIVLR